MEPILKIRDHVDVIAQPAVVRLEHLNAPDAAWVSRSYYVTEETGRHFKALKALFSRENGCGAFLIGHYGSGKSHFLAYLVQQLRAGAFGKRGLEPLPVSLLNYQASQPLEDILDDQLAIPPGQKDRRKKWRQALERHAGGLVLILDELSEFLRSKPTPQSFNEDLRFLQFLGEFSQDHPLWILAALQEQIEHTGEIEYDLFRKIKDRYPMRLLLTPAHVKDLIAERILRKKESYKPAVERLAGELAEIYPKRSVDYGVFCEIYPIHPATLELLEEVRDRFSQSRGIIDFTLTQLLGNEARGIASFLDRPWGHLLTPDAIVDHFADLFEVQPEFLAIAQKVLPYYRKKMPGLFPARQQAELAWRLLKLLILVHLSARRSFLTAEEASRWLFFKVSSIDPARNREIIAKVLESLCRQGAFVKEQDSRYRLDLEDDSREYMEQLLSRTIEELKNRGELAFENLLPLLENSDFNPFSFPRDRWFTRRITWHFHDRDLQIYIGGGVPEQAPEGLALQIGLPWGAPAAGGSFRLVPRPLEIDPDILELSALQDLRSRPLPARVLQRAQERLSARGSWFRSLIRDAYANAAFYGPGGTKIGHPLNPVQGGHAGWLNSYCEWILRQTYPLFEPTAPGHGPLPREAYRQFMKFASEQDLGAEEAPEQVRLIREAYLVPMGLMHRRGPEYVVSQKLENNDLVRLLIPLLDHQPTPERVYRHMSAPVYGLVPDQIHLLLIMLLIQGEIDIVKGDRSYRDIYETLVFPSQYDRILPGRALNVNQLRDLQILCEGFRIAVPRQWSVLAQKRLIEQLRKTGARQRDQLGEFAAGLKAQGEAPDLVEQVERIIVQWNALEKGEHELQGFQHFLYEIGSPQRFVAEAGELAVMPAKFERLMRETRRYRHLFGYPAVSQCAEPDIAARVEALGTPPSLAQPDALELWLREAQAVYQRYREWYQEAHAKYWNSLNRHPVWNYLIPAAARSRHFVPSNPIAALEEAASNAKAARCSGLGPLDFQPLCRCGFDGTESPAGSALARLEKLSAALERDLSLFFQQNEVKAKVKAWADEGLELNTRTLSYLEGKTEYPEIRNLALFDQHLSGLELVQPVDAGSLIDFLDQRVWDRPALVRAFDQYLSRFGPRIRFRRPESREARADLAAWCCEQALRHDVPLPKGLSAEERMLIPGLIQPQWVGEKSLERLEELNLDEDAIARVIGLLLEGAVRLPAARPASGPAAAALDLLQPRAPAGAAEYAELLTCLYEQSERMAKLRPREWFSRLESLASARLEKMPEDLYQLLQPQLDAQWIVVDCLGLPLLRCVRSILPQALPHWKLEKVEFALLSERSSTEAFYMGLIAGDLTRPFEKINGIDALIHARRLTLRDLEKLARAELEVALRKIVGKFDPTKPVLIYGDHGFRMAADGSGFSHGGSSTAERITPVLRLIPV